MTGDGYKRQVSTEILGIPLVFEMHGRSLRLVRLLDADGEEVYRRRYKNGMMHEFFGGDKMIAREARTDELGFLEVLELAREGMPSIKTMVRRGLWEVTAELYYMHLKDIFHS